MSHEYYITYDTATGLELTRGWGAIGTAAGQPLGPGAGVITLPQDIWEDMRHDADAGQQAVRDVLWDRIKAERAYRISLGAPTPHGRFDCDDASWTAIGAYHLKALEAVFFEQSFSQTLTRADNRTIAVNAAEMREIAAAVSQYRDDVHQASLALRAARDAAEGTRALLMIDVTAGWPAEETD